MSTFQQYIINGVDVVGEVSGGETTTYLRGINLICTDEYYYVFDAHGDVVNLTDSTGNTVKSYIYDAFGVEKAIDEADTNPFRYCGEYWDSETETYYFRARYYDPSLGRFTSEDTHWNVSNMIYGDNPIKLDNYGYVPNINAIYQSANLYAYCVNNPVMYADMDGSDAIALVFVPAFPAVTQAMSALASAGALISGGITTAFASIKAAIATVWCPALAAVAVAAAIAAIGYLIYKISAYLQEAAVIQSWVDSRIKDGGLDKQTLHDNSVYVIYANDTGKVWYVGITNNFSRRRYEHQDKLINGKANYPRNEFTMIPIYTGLNRREARTLEQTLINAYTMDALNNSISSIAEFRYGEFKEEFERIESLLSGLVSD